MPDLLTIGYWIAVDLTIGTIMSVAILCFAIACRFVDGDINSWSRLREKHLGALIVLAFSILVVITLTCILFFAAQSAHTIGS